jgi:hypothetical protein
LSRSCLSNFPGPVRWPNPSGRSSSFSKAITMHSFLDVFKPSMHDMLWIQVLGMPIAFLIRAIVLVVRSVREPASRKKHGIRAISNVCFAASCALFSFTHVLAILSFVVGIGLSIWAFMVAKAQAMSNRPIIIPEVRVVKTSIRPKVSKLPARARARTAK